MAADATLIQFLAITTSPLWIWVVPHSVGAVFRLFDGEAA